MVRTPDSETIFLATTLLMAVAAAATSMFFVSQYEFLTANYYMTGTVLLAQIILTYQVTRTNRKIEEAMEVYRKQEEDGEEGEEE